MKTIFSIIFSLTALFTLGQGEGTLPNTPKVSKNKIMPLGASRVQGSRPDFESYRYELWKDLVDGGWSFDFIGTVEDDTSYPQHGGVDFDEDHEGRGGWTTGLILLNISDWVDQTGAPDIVLFSSPGGNDALLGLSYDEAIDNIHKIIDVLQEKNPNVTIIIEQMAPGRSELMSMELTEYFLQMQKDVLEIAKEQTTPTSVVLTVDMFSGFSDDMLADNVHYNEKGASFIANRYYDVLKTILVR